VLTLRGAHVQGYQEIEAIEMMESTERRIGIMEKKDVQYGLADIGCYFDSARGIYIGQAIQAMAIINGWPQGKAIRIVNDSEFYHEATDEAIEFLNDLPGLLEGLYFGYSESGDFGLWPIDCERCAGVGELAVDTLAGRMRDNCPDCEGTGNVLRYKP
jgi:hypothetical protein